MHAVVTLSAPMVREVGPCRQITFKSRKDEVDEVLSYPDCGPDNFSRIELDMGGQPRLKDL